MYQFSAESHRNKIEHIKQVILVSAYSREANHSLTSLHSYSLLLHTKGIHSAKQDRHKTVKKKENHWQSIQTGNKLGPATKAKECISLKLVQTVSLQGPCKKRWKKSGKMHDISQPCKISPHQTEETQKAKEIAALLIPFGL